MKKYYIITAVLAIVCSALAIHDKAVNSTPLETAIEVTATAPKKAGARSEIFENMTQKTDYMVLVNKLNPLPESWESSIKTITFTNSLGEEVEVENNAYNAYLSLKEDLETVGVFVDVDSARRTIAEQQSIMDSFTEEYGADYALKTVATPGCSEHHTGLALDLYLNINNKDVYINEDMMNETEIWSTIHSKLAEHGFILRYPKNKEHITGYGYEPWHIRYIDDADTAKEIMSKGITLEEYLGAVDTYDVDIDLSGSELFTEEELDEAAIQIKCTFATFDRCELHSLRYTGDQSNSTEALEKVKAIDDSADYIETIEFVTAFNSPEDGFDKEITDYKWRLAREDGKGWQLIEYGY